MKITDVNATWLRYPIPEDKQHVSDFGRLATFDMTLVEIETDAGITGYGEAKAQVGSASDNHALLAMIKEELQPLLVGRDPHLHDFGIFPGIQSHAARLGIRIARHP